MSPELRLMVSPRETYAALSRGRTTMGAAAALRRPILVAGVIGVSVALAATRRVSPALALSTTLSWSYIVLLQLLIAVPLLARGARRTVGLARAIDLYFAGHAPWSLFMLFAAAWAPSTVGRPSWPIVAVAVIPIVVTPRIVAAFFGEVLQMDRVTARRMTVLQQAMTWAVFVAIVWMASSLTPRLYSLKALL